MDTPPPLPGYKDFKAGLVIYGILTIVLGILCLFLVVFMVISQLMIKNQPAIAPTQTWQAMAMAVVMYGSIGAANIWMGIGSIMARRWARALLLICSWAWLAMGVGMVISMVVLLPKIIDRVSHQQLASGTPPPPEFFQGIMAGMAVFIGVIFIIIPLLWLFFYGGKNVKATCEARDPVVRWTDACPLPVLGASVLTFCGGLSLLCMPGFTHGTVAFFGTFLSGLAGGAVCVFVAILWLYSSWSLYRLELQGWWIVLITSSLWTISQTLTFSRHSLMEIYPLMYPDMTKLQLEQIRQFTFMDNGFMIWCALFWFIPCLAYMLYIRKFFPKKTV